MEFGGVEMATPLSSTAAALTAASSALADDPRDDDAIVAAMISAYERCALDSTLQPQRAGLSGASGLSALIADLGLVPLSATLLAVQEAMDTVSRRGIPRSSVAALDTTPLFRSLRQLLLLVSSSCGTDEEWTAAVAAFGFALPLTVVSSWRRITPLALAVVCAQLLTVFGSICPALLPRLLDGSTCHLATLLARIAQALDAAEADDYSDEQPATAHVRTGSAGTHDLQTAMQAFASLLAVLCDHCVRNVSIVVAAQQETERESEALQRLIDDEFDSTAHEADGAANDAAEAEEAAEEHADGEAVPSLRIKAPPPSCVRKVAAVLLRIATSNKDANTRTYAFQGLAVLFRLLRTLPNVAASEALVDTVRAEAADVSSALLKYLQAEAQRYHQQQQTDGGTSQELDLQPLPVGSEFVLCAALRLCAALAGPTDPLPAPSGAAAAVGATAATFPGASGPTSSPSQRYFFYTTDVSVAIDMCLREGADLPLSAPARLPWLELLGALVVRSQWRWPVGIGCGKYRCDEIIETLSALATLKEASDLHPDVPLASAALLETVLQIDVAPSSIGQPTGTAGDYAPVDSSDAALDSEVSQPSYDEI
jgi:hypothetical protein